MNYRKLSLILTRGTAGLNRYEALKGSAAEARSYYTTSLSRKTLYSKISPLGDPGITVVPELDKWVENGRKVSVAELQRIVHDLRKRKRFSQALQVSEWMNEKGICIFSTAEHAVQLDLIGKVHGFEAAERYFGKLRDEDKTAKTYGALLNCYVRQNQVDKSLSHFEKMKELGFASPLAYNSIMRLYNNLEQHDKVPDVLGHMKSNNVLPDNYSYRICLTSYGEKEDIGGMEQVLEEMEGQDHIDMDWTTYAVVANFYIKAGQRENAIDTLIKSEKRLALDNGDGVGYNHLISLYSKIGTAYQVLRLWDLQKQSCKRYLNRDYMNMLQSLVRLGAMEEAEKVLKDWESSGNCHDARLPQIVIDAYSEKGMLDKAKSLLENFQKGKERPLTVYLDYVAFGFPLLWRYMTISGKLASKREYSDRASIPRQIVSNGIKSRTSSLEAFIALELNPHGGASVVAFMKSLLDNSLCCQDSLFRWLEQINLRADPSTCLHADIFRRRAEFRKDEPVAWIDIKYLS